MEIKMGICPICGTDVVLTKSKVCSEHAISGKNGNPSCDGALQTPIQTWTYETDDETPLKDQRKPE